MSTVNINNTDNQVTAVNANQSIIITDNGSTAHTSVTVTQPVTSVVLVNALGPVGPQGPSGSGGGGGDFVTTASFNAFTGSYNTGSFTGSFTGSLFGTASWAFSSSQALTASYVANIVTFPYTGSAIITGSLTVTGSINATSITSSLFGTASWAQSASQALTASFLPVATYQITSSWAVSASRAITSSYITGSIFTSTNPALSSSYALTASYAMNGVSIDTSSFATTGSNTFIGDQFITGSVYITGSLNADAQVYEVSFIDRVSSPYSIGDNTIELDQDLITNPNYTRSTNTITVNSSGLYKIYTQCYLQPNLISPTGTDADIAIFINNNAYRSSYIAEIKNTIAPTYDFSCIANLNANDNIEFHINAQFSTFVLYALSPIYNVTCSYMTIEKLN
jgi:hypothetical protein